MKLHYKVYDTPKNISGMSVTTRRTKAMQTHNIRENMQYAYLTIG